MKEFLLKDTKYKIRYNDIEGKDTPILFIHGLGCAGSFDYVEVIVDKSLDSYRKIVVDLLGAGYSDKPLDFNYDVKSHAKYLKDFIEEINLDKVIVFGHSLGGAVAIELCSLISEKVKHLILSESNLDPSKETATSYLLANSDNFEKQINDLVEICEISGDTMWVSSLKNWLPKAVYKISKSAVKGGNPSWREQLYKFSFPKTFIFGEKSLPDNDYDELAKHGINIKIVENAGHSMAWENPKGLAQVINDSIC